MELMKLSEVAKHLRISPRYLQDLRKEDGFPEPVKLGTTKVVFRRVDIDAFVNRGGISE